MFVAVQSRDWHYAAQGPTQLLDVQESLWSEVSSAIPVFGERGGLDRLKRRRADGEERADETRYTVQTNLRGWTLKSASRLYVTSPPTYKHTGVPEFEKLSGG